MMRISEKPFRQLSAGRSRHTQRVWPCAFFYLLVGLTGCTSLSPALPPWSLQVPLAAEAEVGSAKWWKQNRRRAEFVPDEGYRVAGVEGFFDQQGRRIDQPIERTSFAEEQVGLLPTLDPQVSYNRMKKAVGFGPNQQAAQEAFAEAEQQFSDRNYSKAGREYRDAANRWPESRMAEDGLFMRGESAFFGDDYPAARTAYASLIEKYPNTRHMNTVVARLWSIAQFWEREYFDSLKIPLTPNPIDKKRPALDTIGHAIKTYDMIRLNDPTGPRADDAIMATAGIYFRREQYEDADYHYTLLRQEYARSEFQFEAHLLGLQAKLRKYQGPDYDGASLDEAKRLARSLKTQFAGRLRDDDRDRLETVQAELNLKVVQRDYNMAEYYIGKKEYRSARQYLALVSEKYPDSELATQARARLADISDRPDEPPQRLSWLVELFPESRERTRVARIPELQNSATRVAREPKPPPGSGTPDTGVNR